MEFVHPSLLYALFAITIPVVVHLFNFRKFKKVAFTNVKFLKEVKEETQSKSKLKHLLVLLARILAIIFLVFAFAQPFIPAEKSNSDFNINAVSIFIDNSFSMNAEGEKGRLLNEAKEYGFDIINNYKITDKFQIISNDFEGKHQHFNNKEIFSEYLSNIESSAATPAIQNVINRQTDVLNSIRNSNKFIYYLSDFQKSTNQLEFLETDTNISIRLVPLQANAQQNLYIDSIWFASPVHQKNQQEQLTVRIINTSDKKYENIPLRLTINGEQKSINSFTIGGKETVDSTLYFTNSNTLKLAVFQKGMVEITDFPITYDDKFYFNYKIADSIPVTCISDDFPNKNIAKLLANEPLFNTTFSKTTALNYASFKTQNVIILSELKAISSGLKQELQKYVTNGGCLVIIPNTTSKLVSYNTLNTALNIPQLNKKDTSKMKLSSINLEDEFYNNVFQKIPKNLNLPLTFLHYPIQLHTSNNTVSLLDLANNSSFLAKSKAGKGQVYQFASPLDETATNFGKHAIFVPTLFKIILLSSKNTPLYHTLNKDEIMEIQQTTFNTENIIHISSDANKTDFIPELRQLNSKTEIILHNQLKNAGNYELKSNDKLVNILSFNYNKLESQTENYTQEELKTIISNHKNIQLVDTHNSTIKSALSAINNGINYWKQCILFALLFFGIEILLIKLWKN